MTWTLEEERWESVEFVLCEVSITALCHHMWITLSTLCHCSSCFLTFFSCESAFPTLYYFSCLIQLPHFSQNPVLLMYKDLARGASEKEAANYLLIVLIQAYL